MRRRLRDQIHNINRAQQQLRKWRLKVKKHANKSKKSFYVKRYWEMQLYQRHVVAGDYRNDLKRVIAKAYRKSNTVCLVHRSIGRFHDPINNYDDLTCIDAKTNKHICTIPTTRNDDELAAQLAQYGYDAFIHDPYVSFVLE